ncbi:MAG TPA: hypothetical protein VF037_06445 [Gemmatimonadales bacterium]
MPHPIRPLALIVPLAAVALAACGGRDASPRAGADTTVPDSAPPGLVSLIRANEGQRGMMGTVRWVLPSDGSSMLIVEDWSSVENEPFFDGFLFASESTGLVVRVDSVWDAAPSPDWNRVAFGAATLIRGGEADVVPADSFRAAAERLGVSVDEAQAEQFPASGMAAMAGLAQVGIVDVATGSQRMLPLLAGWRVRWSSDGRTLIVGRGPLRSDDDDPPARWIVADPATGAVAGPAEAGTGVAPEWVMGPTLDMSVEPDTGRVAITVEGGEVVSDSGRIRLRGHEIGAGVALAATRRGCFIAALVPDSLAGEYDPKHRLAVYDTGCRR